MRLSREIASAASAGGATKLPRGRRVFVYVRVSTAREEMIAPELQEASVRAYCAREGLEIIDVISDLDLSGRDFAKRKIMWMIRQIADKAADGVAVWQVSRWGRSMEQSLNHIRKLEDEGGFLRSATENLNDMETPFGRFALTQLLAMAQLQSDQIRAGWLQVHERRRQLGLPVATGARFGYTYDPDARVFVPVKAGLTLDTYPLGCHVQNDEAQWLRYAYERRIANVPLTRVAIELQDLGVTTRAGKLITYNMLHSALDSGFGAGLISQEQDPNTGRRLTAVRYYPGAHEPVIDADQWAVYVERRSDNKPPRLRNPTHVLSGLTRCSSCGKPLARNRPNGAWSYECPANRVTRRVPCPRKASMREWMILDELEQWLVEQSRGEHASHYARDERYRAATLASIDELERKLVEQRRIERTTVRLMTSGKLDEELATERLAEVRDERERLTTRVAELRTAQGSTQPPPTPAQLDVLRRLLRDPRVSGLDANLALQRIVREIVVHPATHRGQAARERLVFIPTWEASPSSDGELSSIA